MKKIAFIVNPVTRYAKFYSEEEFKQLLGADYQITTYVSKHIGHETDLATEAVKHGAEIIVAVGGDGTLHHIAQAIRHSNVQLAVMPTTIGSSFANYYQIPKNNYKIAQIIKDGYSQEIDCIVVKNEVLETRYGLCYVGCGFSPVLVEGITQESRNFFSRYWVDAFKLFDQYNRQEIELSYNFKQKKTTIFEIIICNINQYGGKLMLTPNASATDGKLDLMIIEKISKFRLFLFSILSVFGFRDNIFEVTDFDLVEDVQLNFNQSSMIQIDMENFPVYGNISVQIEKKAYRILVPKP